MSFNLKTFQTRTITAIIFAAVMLAGLLYNHWSFFILFTIIHFGCWWEYFNLIEKKYSATGGNSIHPNTRVGFMLLGFAIMLQFCGSVFEINNYRIKDNFSLPVSIGGFILLAMGTFQTSKINLKLFLSLALGFLYISLCWGLMVDLFQQTPLTNFTLAGNFIPIVIIASIWINDTMAYIVGSLIGKTPLSKVSPKKTWEGTIGGILLCVAFMGFLFTKLFYPFLHNQLHFFLTITAALAAIFGTIGDLLESKLKRMADVKDSGNFMPGHGGFLDRFDSLLLAVPAVWLYVYFIIS
jgi:phosphatidate cytidylyltransferase